MIYRSWNWRAGRNKHIVMDKNWICHEGGLGLDTFYMCYDDYLRLKASIVTWAREHCGWLSGASECGLLEPSGMCPLRQGCRINFWGGGTCRTDSVNFKHWLIMRMMINMSVVLDFVRHLELFQAHCFEKWICFHNQKLGSYSIGPLKA
jgi:hypothetical protein